MIRISFKKFLVSLLLASTLFLSFCPPGSSCFALTAESRFSTADYKADNVYSGFKLLSKDKVSEGNSELLIFSHVKTGARLLFVKNRDSERAFSISFRTPATDDTGVNHIIEHSVLNGSKNYPVKSPFAEMLKRSLGTFINAMTTNDYTIYPVSSTNEKDLQNLMSIYLDAVFYPSFHTDSNIFKQEAWRYQLNSKDARLSLNGIVFNEMKGYYSNPAYILDREIYKSLFPDTSYKWDSGGNPEVIPSLTYQQFKAVHEKYYTPSNSYIYLYGDLDVAKYLEFIDKNYLSKMEKTETDSELKLQQPFAEAKELVAFYPVQKNARTDRKTYMSMNFVTGNITDKDLLVNMDFLSYLLMGSDNSPLTKALFSSGIADNFTCSFKPDSLQPVFTITAENSDEASKEAFKKIVMDTLKKTVATGFDKELLEFTFAQYDLRSRIEKLSSLKGLSMNFNIMKSWLYDRDPALYLDNSKSIDRIKELADKKYFENLIDKYLLSNTHSSLVVLKPSAGMETTSSEAWSQKLQDYKKSLDSKTVVSMVKDTKAFDTWQKKPDSKKALATIPRLTLNDIKPELPDLKINTSNVEGTSLIYHNVYLNGLSSINFYFDTSKVPQDKLYYLNLLSSLMGNLTTKQYSLKELNNAMLLCSSGIRFSPVTAADYRKPGGYKPMLQASFLTLNDNIPESLDLLEEIINNSVIDDKYKIKQAIQQNKLHMQQIYSSGTGLFSSLKFNAYLSPMGRYNEEVMGPGYLRFLLDLEKNFDDNWNTILKNLLETYSIVFNKNGLIVSHSGDVQGLGVFKKELSRILPKLREETLVNQEYSLKTPDKNLALPLPVKVQTLLKGGSFSKEGYQYSGKMLVLQRILNMDYLWKNVRTSGGAYGVDVSFSRSGLLSFMSMRDPNLSETLNIFDGAVKYLKEFKATDEEMENFIIGTISEFTKLKSKGPLYEGAISDNLYLTGLTSNDLVQIMDETLSTKAEDINKYSEMLEKVLSQNIYYVEGSQEKITENQGLFTRLDNIMN